VSTPPLTPEEQHTLKRQLLKKGAEINEKLVALLNGQSPKIDDLLTAKPGETPIERLRRFLALVDGRLVAIRNGTYGKCESCGAWLPFQQLHEVPWIDTCADCARKAG
jgi:DnaK suppressor protein